MKRIALSALVLPGPGCSDGRYVDHSEMPQALEPVINRLRLANTAVRTRSEGSKVTFLIQNGADTDLCLPRTQWVGWTQSVTRAFDPSGREYAYVGVLNSVVGDVGPPVRIPKGQTLRHMEDLAGSYNVQDWNKVRVTYDPVVEPCPEAGSAP